MKQGNTRQYKITIIKMIVASLFLKYYCLKKDRFCKKVPAVEIILIRMRRKFFLPSITIETLANDFWLRLSFMLIHDER